MTLYLCQMKNKPYDEITTFSSKEESNTAPYYSETKARRQLIVYVIVFFIQERYA